MNVLNLYTLFLLSVYKALEYNILCTNAIHVCMLEFYSLCWNEWRSHSYTFMIMYVCFCVSYIHTLYMYLIMVHGTYIYYIWYIKTGQVDQCDQYCSYTVGSVTSMCACVTLSGAVALRCRRQVVPQSFCTCVFMSKWFLCISQ